MFVRLSKCLFLPIIFYSCPLILGGLATYTFPLAPRTASAIHVHRGSLSSGHTQGAQGQQWTRPLHPEDGWAEVKLEPVLCLPSQVYTLKWVSGRREAFFYFARRPCRLASALGQHFWRGVCSQSSAIHGLPTSQHMGGYVVSPTYTPQDIPAFRTIIQNHSPAWELLIAYFETNEIQVLFLNKANFQNLGPDPH